MRTVAISVLLIMLSLAQAKAQLPTAYDNCPHEHVQDFAESLQTDYDLAGVQFAVAQFGELRCAGAVGYADKGTNRPLTPTTMMRIGSISKVVTAVAVMRLVEDEQVGLDDKLVDLLAHLFPSA